MIRRSIITNFGVISLLFATAVPAYAHVVVKPGEVGAAAFQTFTMGVPNERDNPTVKVRLMIPQGLKYVSPNVKPGWEITIKKDGEGEDAKVTEIDWTGGSIPADQRDEFIFSAQAPAAETTLTWDAYQVYKDGETVAWIHEPSGRDNDEGEPPHSITKVVKDIGPNPGDRHMMTADAIATASSLEQQLPLYLSSLALLLSVIALGVVLTKKK